MPENNNYPGFTPPDNTGEGQPASGATGQSQSQEPPAQNQPHFLDEFAETYGEDLVNSYKSRIPLDENGMPDPKEVTKMLLESQRTIGRLGTELGSARKELAEFADRQPSQQHVPSYANFQAPQQHQPGGQPVGGMASQQAPGAAMDPAQQLRALGFDPDNYQGYLTQHDLAMILNATNHVARNAIRESMQNQQADQSAQFQSNWRKMDRLSEYAIKDLTSDPNSGIDALRVTEVKNAIRNNPAYMNRFVEMAQTGQYDQESVKQVILDVHKDLDRAEQMRLQRAMKSIGPTQAQVADKIDHATNAGISPSVGQQGQQRASNQTGDGLLLDASKYGPATAQALKDYGFAE